MSLSKQIAALQDLPLLDLRKEFLRVMKRPTNSGDKAGMALKIVERLGEAPAATQPEIATAAAKTEKPKGKARKAPATTGGTKPSPFATDPRLPAIGSTIERLYKGKTHTVKVTPEGFVHEGETYRSLSALARKITGAASINGLLFFRLTGRPAPAAKAETPAAPKAKRAAKAKKAPRAKAAKSSAKKS
jgi:hypothetical protein